MYTIYRIENPDGEGPYNEYHYYCYCLRIAHNNDNYPSFTEDLEGKEIAPEEFELLYCACPSKQLLYKWFYGWITKLRKENFFVVKITVSNYIMGNSGKQCFFKQENVISKEII